MLEGGWVMGELVTHAVAASESDAAVWGSTGNLGYTTGSGLDPTDRQRRHTDLFPVAGFVGQGKPSARSLVGLTVEGDVAGRRRLLEPRSAATSATPSNSSSTN
jgi:hypothetical protein